MFVAASATLVLLASALVGFAADCCLPQGSWNGTPCSGSATTWCEEASGSGGPWEFSTGTRLAQCTTYTLEDGYFVQQDCNNPPFGFYKIGPAIYGNTCCFAPSNALVRVSVREFGIVPCSERSCGNGTPGGGGGN